MTPTSYAALRVSVQTHEGLSLTMYTDTTGHWTIGYGRNIQNNGITKAEAEAMLDHDLETAIVQCQKSFPWFNGADGPRQQVIAELMFEMGPKTLGEFTHMLAAVAAGTYDLAASELLRSTWASQVGSTRSRQMADLLQSEVSV